MTLRRTAEDGRCRSHPGRTKRALMAKVFISYAKEDHSDAKRLYGRLRTAGHEPWLDTECLMPGQRWGPAIEAAIRGTEFFVAVLSANSVEKPGYVQTELQLGLEVLNHFPESRIFLIPLRISNCDPKHHVLRERQWLDFFPAWEEGFSRLLKVLDFIPSKQQDTVPTLAGSNWLSTLDSYKDWSFHLRSDGVVVYVQLDHGKEFENGTWQQTGDELYIEFNNRFAQYRGVVRGNRISGTAQNLSGLQWNWGAVRHQLYLGSTGGHTAR
jgi:hypothetical protein